MNVNVWAPPRDEWRLTTENGTLTLALKSKEGDPEPRWQALGKMNLTEGTAAQGRRDQGCPEERGLAPPKKSPSPKTEERRANRPRAGAGTAVAFVAR